jgi:uncharacterized protein YcfJ
MKCLLIIFVKIVICYMIMVMVFSTGVFAQNASNVKITDFYNERSVGNVYDVERCRQVKKHNKNETDNQNRNVLLGALLGALIGNQMSNGDSTATTASGIAGALIGGDAVKPNKKSCVVRKTIQKIYSHSVITFRYEGKRYSTEFYKSR